MSPRIRTDWLKELQAGIGLIVVVLGAITLARLGSTVLGSTSNGGSPVTVLIPADAVSGTVVRAGEGLTGRARPAASGPVEVAITDPTVTEYLLYTLTWLPGACVAIAAAAMLFVLVRRAGTDEAFTARTVRRLRDMGVVTLAGGTLAGGVAILANFALSSGVLKSATAGAWEFPWGWVLGGVAVFAIADVMARAQRMREDLDGVI